MVRHIVFWKFRPQAEGRSARENRALVAGKLRALPDHIPGILGWEVAECEPVPGDEEMVELCLCSLFANPRALADYAVHPQHLEVVTLLRRVRAEKRVADYETGQDSGA